MAGKYSVGFVTAAAGPTAAYAVLQNTDVSGGRRLRVVEVGFTSNANTALPIQLSYIVPAGLGTASGSPLVGIPSDDEDTQIAKGTVATTWSVAPTTPLNAFRNFFGVATAGAGYIWTFDEPLVISPTAGLALWNPNVSLTGPACSAWFRWQE